MFEKAKTPPDDLLTGSQKRPCRPVRVVRRKLRSAFGGFAVLQQRADEKQVQGHPVGEVPAERGGEAY